MNYIRVLLFGILLLSVSANSLQAACDTKAAERTTGEMNRQLAILVGFTMVQCAPSEDAGKCSIVCITTSLEKDDNVSILLVAITAMSAVNMRKIGVGKFSRVTFANKNLLQRRRYLAISAARANQLQAEFSKLDMKPVDLMRKIRPEYLEQAISESGR
jgi:hypothetical protein